MSSAIEVRNLQKSFQVLDCKMFRFVFHKEV